MAGIFQKIKGFLMGTDPIEVHGGNKGGYAYIIFFDPKSKQILHQYISPPKQQSKNTSAAVGVVNLGLTGSVNYQSEEAFGDPFAVTNDTSTLKVDPKILLAKYNEGLETKLSQPTSTYFIAGDKKFLAGAYMVPVSTNNVECPNFEAHFPSPDPRVDDLLNTFPEFIINAFWPEEKTFRSSIFLHDALKKELKMHCAYNMTGYVDYMLGLPDMLVL